MAFSTGTGPHPRAFRLTSNETRPTTKTGGNSSRQVQIRRPNTFHSLHYHPTTSTHEPFANTRNATPTFSPSGFAPNPLNPEPQTKQQHDFRSCGHNARFRSNAARHRSRPTPPQHPHKHQLRPAVAPRQRPRACSPPPHPPLPTLP